MKKFVRRYSKGLQKKKQKKNKLLVKAELVLSEEIERGEGKEK